MFDRRRLLRVIGYQSLASLMPPLFNPSITISADASMVEDAVVDDAVVETKMDPDRSKRTLLLCGGGKLPDSLLDVFCERGNASRGRLVLIPTASPRSDEGDYSPWLDLWVKKGWKDVMVVHANDRQMAMQDGFGAELREAQAVWIGGGDQSRLSQRYCGTDFLQRMLEWYNHGGVLGGTSAGAAVMSARMIVGGVDDPQFGEGFGVLPNVIIDQHFAQKNRIARLTKAVAQSNDVIGVGIDECTGWLLEGTRSKVIGEGSVHVIHRSGSIVVHQAGEASIQIP